MTTCSKLLIKTLDHHVAEALFMILRNIFDKAFYQKYRTATRNEYTQK